MEVVGGPEPNVLQLPGVLARGPEPYLIKLKDSDASRSPSNTHPRQVNGTDSGLPDSGETVRPRKTGKMGKPVTVLVFISEQRPLQQWANLNTKRDNHFKQCLTKSWLPKKKKRLGLPNGLWCIPRSGMSDNQPGRGSRFNSTQVSSSETHQHLTSRWKSFFTGYS